jgi:hypothetical protein
MLLLAHMKLSRKTLQILKQPYHETKFGHYPGKERLKLGHTNVLPSSCFDFHWRLQISTAEPSANRQHRCLSVQ